MVKCPICREKNPENTLYCDECGSYLLGGKGAATAPLTAAEVTWMGREVGKASGVDDASPLDLRLTMSDNRLDVEVPLTARGVNIGRLDPHSAVFPDVDLTDYGGIENGVSRRHAMITQREREVFIEDLGSGNGTFLNREKLTPHIPQVLKSGDELRLGGLTLRVSFK